MFAIGQVAADAVVVVEVLRHSPERPVVTTTPEKSLAQNSRYHESHIDF